MKSENFRLRSEGDFVLQQSKKIKDMRDLIGVIEGPMSNTNAFM